MATAGLFKNAVKDSVALNKDSAGAIQNDGFTTIYTAPSGLTSYIIECDIACIETSGVQVSVRLKTSSGTKVHVVKSAPVPVGSAIQIINGQKLVLMPGDSLEVKPVTPDAKVDVIVSLVEDVNM
jgi:hypothetical protein